MPEEMKLSMLSSSTSNENLFRAEFLTYYLLGELTEHERELIEHEYFVNPVVWAELIHAENDLIDSYLRGDLSQHQHEQFEKYFLVSPQKRERVDLTRILMHVA